VEKLQMVNLSDAETLALSTLAEAISKQLDSIKIHLFKVKPTVYVTLGDQRLHIALADEGKEKIDVLLLTTKKKSVFDFFIYRFMFEDFFDLDSHYINVFADMKVKDYLAEVQEINAYSRNLQRTDSLINSKHYYAALIVLVSAFEVASRDIFFRGNSYWFFHLGSSTIELYERFGEKLSNEQKNSSNQKHRIQVSIGDVVYGFDHASYDKLKKWESVLRNDKVLDICRQIGIREEYLQKLYGNSFQEIEYYEILYEVLQHSKKRPINFQMLDGDGGMKWCFRNFFSINLDNLQNEIKTLKECFHMRHQVIHGELDDAAITEERVLELRSAIRKIIDYLRNEIMTLEWTMD
jgi:hypothetical protein